MSTALKIPEPALYSDRPGWIPAEILYDWDTNPYAYQTEEELMPAGGLHGKLNAYVIELLRDFLENRGLMLLPDTFMLYRDRHGIKQRIVPDLLLMPFREYPPSAYDLDIEPPPLCVTEITSPKSRQNDLKNKLPFYTGLGIPAYLVIDAVTPKAELRSQIRLYLWRNVKGQIREIMPNAGGWLIIPEMKVKIRAQGQRLIFADALSGEILHDTGQLKLTIIKERQISELERLRAESAEKKAELERRKAESAEKKAELERRRAESAEKKMLELAEKLRAMGIDPDNV